MKKIILSAIISIIAFCTYAQSSETLIISSKTQAMKKVSTISVVNSNGLVNSFEFKGMFPIYLEEHETELAKQIELAISDGYTLLDTEKYSWGNPGTEAYYTRFIFKKE